MTATFWQHRIKCMSCGLHYIICSDYEDWWDNSDLADGAPSCPECHSKLRENGAIHWKAKVEGFIFQYVEGKDAHMDHMIMPKKATKPMSKLDNFPDPPPGEVMTPPELDPHDEANAGALADG